MKKFEGYMHGINLGGWFSQCDNSEKRYDYFIRREDFRRISRWGVDHVRLPVDYNLVQNPDGSFKEQGFDRLKNCIEWCGEYGLNIVLDLHKTIGFSFDKEENELGFFENRELQEHFFKLWEEFAKRFSSYGNVAFELLNEVTEKKYKDSWNSISAEAVERIRKFAPDTIIIIGGYYNNDASAVKDLLEPADGRIVYSFHCYSPLIFTHQGAYWIEKMDTSFRMPFTASYAEYIENTEKYIGKEHKDIYAMDGSEAVEEKYFENVIAEAAAVAEERGVPLYCGEYGVIDRADADETLKWFRCISRVFDRHGIGRAVRSYKEMDFGLIEAHYDDVRDEIIKLL